jgi:hypothetical protein
MKQLFKSKISRFCCFLLFLPFIIGGCKQKSNDTSNTSNMENTADTTNHSIPVSEMQLPEASPLSQITQYIGVTELSIRYHRPSLYNDTSGLQYRVPHDQLWTPGHHIVKFSTSDTIMIKDKKLPAGDYSLLMIPGEKSWVMIFNSEDTLYNINQYNEKNDVLRINVDAQKTGYTKDFTFSFSDILPNTAILCVNWGSTSLRVPIFINNEKKVTETFETAFSKADKDDWHIYVSAANYYLEACVNLDKGLEWINKSIAIKETHANMWTKAELYAAKGDYKNAVIYGEKANELGKTEPNEARQKHFDYTIALWKEKTTKKQTKKI